MSLKDKYTTMSNIESGDNLDYVMRTSYESLMIDTEKTINEFIVFTRDDEVIEIERGLGERSKFIDVMIQYFEDAEVFEFCANLVKLKRAVIEDGD